MSLLKQSTAITLRFGPFLDSTDGDTEETALTIAQADVRLSKAGAAFAQKTDATAGTHDEKGWYSIPLDVTDTGTLGILRVSIHVAGALAVFEEFMVVPANMYDSNVLGTDLLDVTVVDKTGFSLSTAGEQAIWASVTRTLTAGTKDAEIDSISYDVSTGGVTLSPAAIDAIWDELTAGHSIASSFAVALKDTDTGVNNVEAKLPTGTISDVTASQVNSEVVDALTVDTIPELAQAQPPTTPTIVQAIQLLYMAIRNQETGTATERAIYNNAGTKIAKGTLSDDGTTFTKAKLVSGV